MFGTPGAEGKPEPFHKYTMRQAIEEKFILDVLANYTTYTTYYRLVKKVADDPEVEKSRAARALARFMSLHPHNLAQKTEVMVEHFRAFTKDKIGGRAKAMVVTASRLHAVRYKQSFDRYIAEKRYTDVRTLVAFSGVVRDPDAPGVEYRERDMNGGISETELPGRFAGAEYQVLLVAEKYQTRAVEEQKVPLSSIIGVLNDRFGTDFQPADELFFDQLEEEALVDGDVVDTARANSLENFQLAQESALERLMLRRMGNNEEIVARYLNEPQFKAALLGLLLPRIYRRIREPGEAAESAGPAQRAEADRSDPAVMEAARRMMNVHAETLGKLAK